MYRGKSIIVFEEKTPREQVKRLMLGHLFREELHKLDYDWWHNRETPWKVDPEPLKRILAETQTLIVELAMEQRWELDPVEGGAFLHTIMTEGHHDEYQKLWELRQSLRALQRRIYRNKQEYCPKEEQWF